MNTAGVLFVYGVVFLFAAVNIVNIVAHRRRAKRDDLMALADSLKTCGAVGRASELGHLWHDCHLGADRVGHPMHYCRCGAYWRTPAYISHEIGALEAMLDDPVEPDGRTR